MRLDKYLTQSSIGTRKKVHKILQEGHIAVNGVPVSDAVMDIDEENDDITYRGEKVNYLGRICYMFHKPKGCISSRSADDRQTVLSYFHEINTEGIFIVGRLDKDTEGLLLLTNDGVLDHKLMNPDNHIDKTYFFWAVGNVSEEEIERLENGIVIDGNGEHPRCCKPAVFKVLKQGMYSEFRDEVPAKLHEDHVVCGLLTISEGQKHQVKRMLRAVDCRIFYLKRVAIGNLKLDVSLKPGEYRALSREEIEAI